MRYSSGKSNTPGLKCVPPSLQHMLTWIAHIVRARREATEGPSKLWANASWLVLLLGNYYWYFFKMRTLQVSCYLEQDDSTGNRLQKGSDLGGTASKAGWEGILSAWRQPFSKVNGCTDGAVEGMISSCFLNKWLVTVITPFVTLIVSSVESLSPYWQDLLQFVSTPHFTIVSNTAMEIQL